MLHVLRAGELLVQELTVALERELRSDDDGRRKVGEGEHLEQVGNDQRSVVGDAEHFRALHAIGYVECEADQMQHHHAVTHRPTNVVVLGRGRVIS